MKKSKNVFIILFIFIFLILLIYCPISNGADPKIVTKLNSAFNKIESWILKLSTPAAAVAVGTGIFIKKFSFGDEERLRLGKRLIRGSLFSYAFVLATDLILAAIKSLIG